MAITPLADHGVSLLLPTGWEGRAFVRAQPRIAATVPVDPQSTAPLPEPPDSAKTGQDGWPGEVTRPVIHVGNFALPADRGDYGSGAVDIMRGNNVFIALLEFGKESVGTALFAAVGVPLPEDADFSPNMLQRRLPGQLGYQQFFTVSGRPFCAYVVLGGRSQVSTLAGAARVVLSTLEVTP